MPNFIKPPKTQRLPDIVTVEQAQALFAATHTPELQGVLFYGVQHEPATERRLEFEGGCIDADRHRVHIRDSKGNRDRFVLLPEANLTR